MSNFNVPYMKPMTEPIEQVNPNVFRVHRTDLRHNPDEVFSEIYKTLQSHYNCLIVSSRHRAYVNGSGKLIEGVDNDYRSHYLIITHKNTSHNVTFCDHTFEVILDHYNRLSSVLEPEYGIELMTVPSVRDAVLDEYKRVYNVSVNIDTGEVVNHAA